MQVPDDFDELRHFDRVRAWNKEVEAMVPTRRARGGNPN